MTQPAEEPRRCFRSWRTQRPAERKDFTGLRLGDLVALRPGHWSAAGILWIWACQRCGEREVEALPSALKKAVREVKSGKRQKPVCCADCALKAKNG